MKKQAIVILVAIMVAFTFSTTLFAQEGRGTGRMTGYVTDQDKKPIEGVKLTMEYQGVVRVLEATTDEKGKFTFLGLGKGSVKIKAEKSGFANAGIVTTVSGVKKNPIQYIVMQTPEEADPNAAKNLQSKDDFTRAIALYENRKFQEALDLFNKVRGTQPQAYKLGINVGNCLLELQRYDEAFKEFKTVLDKLLEEKPDAEGNKELAKLYASLGEIFMRQDKFAEAETYFKKSIAIDTSDHALAYNVAEILFVAGKTDGAIKYYKLAIQIKPDWPKPFQKLGYAFLNKGDTTEAIKNLKKFVELDPNSPDVPGIEEVIKSLQ